MIQNKLADGTVHKLPPDLKKALMSVEQVQKAWQSLTPLARNEWICWNITVARLETRKEHIKRTIKELQEGKRRPCCWIGCVHRKDKALSPSVRWVLSKQSRKN
jgi:uncharacterized protein YdeI (YjbR/CyaY-like superfamily)